MLSTGLRCQGVCLFCEPRVEHFVLKRGAFALGDLKEPHRGLFTVRVFKRTCLIRDLAQKFIFVCPFGPPFRVLDDHAFPCSFHRRAP